MTILEALKILAQLFFTFFTTGLFTIGGGQAMIGLLETELVNNLGWIDFETFQNFVTVSESTPGPIVINMATFIGQELFVGADFGNPILNIFMPLIGSLTATIGVVLPSFVIILIIAKIMDKFITNKYVKFALKGIRPFIIGIIIVAASKFFYNSCNIAGVINEFNKEVLDLPTGSFISQILVFVNALVSFIDIRAIVIMIIAFVLTRFKKTSHPLIIIGASAVLGVILYGLF